MNVRPEIVVTPEFLTNVVSSEQQKPGTGPVIHPQTGDFRQGHVFTCHLGTYMLTGGFDWERLALEAKWPD
jgi:hypothetical protein